MQALSTAVILTVFFILSLPGMGSCLSANDMIRLKNAGIDDMTIQTIINEKTFETCLFTVDEILDLKKNGISNATIRSAIESASSVKDREVIEYGTDVRPVRFITLRDIIALKHAGITDEVIRAVISGARDEGDEDQLRAWRMLEKMGIIVDKR